ncbi:MAG: hypothetical protein C9356_08200 [Oleiphilus sp.]|nr:MAG: hypothetical protein C9356_08200 [Oleiphilus sp.]
MLLLSTLVTSAQAYAFSDASDAATPVLNYSATGPFPIEIGSNMLYLRDPEHVLDIETVLTQPPVWETIDRPSPNFGFTSSAYWFNFKINNASDQVERVFIELPIPFLDDVRLYRVSGENILEQQFAGDIYPFGQRPVKHQNLVLPFELAPGHNQMIARVATAGTVEAPLFIWDPEAFTVATADNRLIQGVWFGVLGIMVFYNLFLFALLRDRSYLYYVAFTSSYLMFEAALKGYGFAYFWPNQLHWNSYAISVFIAASNLFAMIMVISFLKLRTKAPRTFNLLAAYTTVAGFMFLLSFVLPYTNTIRINSALGIVTCLLSITTGYLSWYHGNRDAKYFCLAWSSAIAGIGVLLATKFGVAPANFWTNNAGQIGVLALVTLLSFALANRFNREKELRLNAQESSLESEQLVRKSQEELLRSRLDANKKLERKVAERTETLEKAMQELETVNKKLEIMSTTDALTGIHNRGHFENNLQTEFQRAVRHHRPLSIILCDIDHFKRVNDTYGHKAGDACLQSVAAVFRKRISRPGDLVARYGGEEFIVLLADTTIDQAKGIALALCGEIRAMHFIFSGKPISVTASFGVSTLNNVGAVSADQLVTQADLSLYEAKANGRDQVICWDADRNGPEKNQILSSYQA